MLVECCGHIPERGAGGGVPSIAWATLISRRRPLWRGALWQCVGVGRLSFCFPETRPPVWRTTSLCEGKASEPGLPPAQAACGSPALGTAHSQRLLFPGEASASTMWDNNAWTFFYDNSTDGEPPFLTQDFIHAFQPDVKLIVMLRDPVER